MIDMVIAQVPVAPAWLTILTSILVLVTAIGTFFLTTWGLL
jgi:hypothetical protein